MKNSIFLPCILFALMTTALLSAQAQRAAMPVPAPAMQTDAPPASAPAAPAAPLNPLKIAQLHWYLANLSAKFPIGNQPYGLCFDGANIWSANLNGNTVSKLRAADGAPLGTFKVGNQPYGLCFDGANIWSANLNGNTVSKLRAADGA